MDASNLKCLNKYINHCSSKPFQFFPAEEFKFRHKYVSDKTNINDYQKGFEIPL